ncbi:LlaJI family restriction endonuclease [Clostridium algidicarnis]|uniref:LlaJI family restriction endonuclease n=1 Tax=Clostridium algidicarnis TaxID=37659 RepID=UPI001C0D1DEF|nr:LlaJI family restriction endonuclease [Clostridium algidicarnis]MBU3206975.1 LlaJI family restriction endonuclease [Clostridium algidicarnis]
MGIVSEFVREQKRYTRSDLKRNFCFSSDEIDGFIKNLKAFGVLKAVKNNSEQCELSDLVDEDIEVTDVESGSDNYLYVFTYVGIITIGSRIIKCYPKYILAETTSVEEMKQVLKVIGKYGSKEQVINLYNGDAEYSSFNILAVILFLLNDYHDYGVYNNSEDIVEINGEGEILWDKTVNDVFPLIINNRPYYMELYTEKTIDDEFDFFKRLHECILTECSKQLETCDLLDLFDLVAVNLSEETLDDFGEVDYILYRLRSELNIQFNTRKQILLKTLYAYIAHNRTLEDSYGVSMYGTNSFNLVWEDVCAEVLSNKLQTPIGQLELPIPLLSKYQPNDKLIDIIRKPVWIGNKEGGRTFDKTAKDTLIPDLITIRHQGGTYQFIIFDAKYYNIQLEQGKPLRGQPGVSDITKQYLYQLAYKDFLDDQQINDVKNYFLMPVQSNEIINKGIAKMDILSSLGLQDIQIRQLPAKIIYDYYLSGRKMDVSLLNI